MQRPTVALPKLPSPGRNRHVTCHSNWKETASTRQAQTLIRSLVQRVGRSVPTSLMDEATWATSTFAPFVRMAICMSVRRSLAASLRRRWGSVADAAATRPIEAVADVMPDQGDAPAAPDGG